jgi:hypothetical protein
MTLRELTAADIPDRNAFLQEVAEPCRPVVIRQWLRDWPVVAAAERSPRAFQEYVSQFGGGKEAEIFIGEPRIGGKYFYSDDLKGFNFERRRVRFIDALDSIVSTIGRAAERSIYLGSLPIDDYLPGFSKQNALSVLAPEIVPRLWLGHASVVSAHYDTLDNIACVVAGTRRFKLFAPETISHLYVGPLDHTMAGQPVSLAASAPPDDERYPRFREVKDQALLAELQAGDAIYIPKLWWHQVEATSSFNALVNYWWDAFSIGPDAPSTSLLLSMLTISERPLAERRAWRAFFDHYVFRTEGHPLAHLPSEQHGILGPLKPHNYGRIRARVMQLLRGE